MDRTYKGALELLNALRRQTRPAAKASTAFADLPQMPAVNGEPQMKGTPSIHGMRQWLLRLGHTSQDIDNLNIIHVAGTKGKGSTCALIDSFLRAFGSRHGFPRKVGLYTSPHLVCPEERIRINFAPLSRQKFADYVFQVRDLLASSSQIEDEPEPRYLQLLALVSFHAFIKEGVDAAIYETHHGGAFDATNVIENPVATVITSLGMDHVAQLGPTLENIAWHKAGILKAGAPAFSPLQDEAAAKVLKARAAEKSTAVEFVPPNSSLELNPDVQVMNGSVALAAAQEFLHRVQPQSLNISKEDIKRGLANFAWPGRFQIINEPKEGFEATVHVPKNRWFLDAAHNEMSVSKAAQWFVDMSPVDSLSKTLRILIFSQSSDQREGAGVLRELAENLKNHPIDHAIFTTYDVGGTGTSIKWVEEGTEVYEQLWKSVNPATQTCFKPNIREAVDAARSLSKEYGGMQVLVTGSQFLVGGVLWLLKPEMFGATDVS